MKRTDVKKLMFIVPHFRGGGVERVISYLESHSPAGFEVILTSMERPKISLIRSKIYVVKKYSKPTELFKCLLEYYRILRREKPAVVIGRKKGLNLALLTFGPKIVIRVESYPGKPYVQGLKNRLFFFIKFNILYRRAYKIIAISEEIKRCLVEEYNLPSNKIVTIYNPCDIYYIKKLAEEPLDTYEKELFASPILLNVARLVLMKGQYYLIRIFKKVNEEIPNAKLVIIGEGNLREYLENLISGIGLKGKAVILGWKSNPFKYMSWSTLFCLSSLREGFGNVVVEALACGLPVMSTDCLSGPREILAPGTEYKVEKLRQPEYGEYGILMPVFDGKKYSADDPLTWQEEVWAEEIIKLLKNPEILENYRKKARKRAMDFEVKKQVQKYFDVIFNQS